MNSFSKPNKESQTKLIQRIKIKSKYFGQYEPQLFITSKSKSKSKSISKDQLNIFISKQPKQNIKSKGSTQLSTFNNDYKNSINPQLAKSPKSFNTGGLSQYLLSRNISSVRKKQKSAIQKIIYWIEKKYYEKIINKKIVTQQQILTLQQNYKLNRTKQQKFQYWIKKLAYDMYILKRLKVNSYMNVINQIKLNKQISKTQNNNFSQIPNKQHDIDNINMELQKDSQKVEDFGIFKFKNNLPYEKSNNLFPISQLSFQNINRSEVNNANYQPQKQDYCKEKLHNQIPTMNSFQTLKLNIKGNNNKQIQDKYSKQNQNLASQNSRFFTQTARSISTNQILQNSKNSFFQNSLSEKDKSIQINNRSLRNQPFSDKDLKKSFTIEGVYERQYPNYQSNFQKNYNQSNMILSNQFINYPQQKMNHKNQMKSVNNLFLNLNRNIHNQIQLIDINYSSDAAFNPQKISQVIIPIQINTLNAVNQQNEQILNQIFQMNDNQQQILKILKLKNKANTQSNNPRIQMKLPQIVKNKQQTQNNKKVQVNQNNQLLNLIRFQTNSNKIIQVGKNKQNKKTVAQNYFSLHLQTNTNFISKQEIKTFPMPLIKAQTDMAVKNIQTHAKLNLENTYAYNNLTQSKSPQKQVFTFNSISSQNQSKPQNTKLKTNYQQKRQQKNAFIQKFDCFGLCKNVGQLQRSNYFTGMSTTERQRGTSCNSNQSKKSSKPKVNFNYLSPSSKNTPVQINNKSQHHPVIKKEILQMNQYGAVPTKIQIKQLKQNKNGSKIQMESLKIEFKTELYNKIKQQVSPKSILNNKNEQIVKQQAISNQLKQRSQSVPHFVAQRHQQLSRQKINQPRFDIKNNVLNSNNAFVNKGYELNSQYQSQKVISNARSQHTIGGTLYKNVQSYYFPNIPSQMINTQIISPGANGLSQNRQQIISRKDTKLESGNGIHYLYPIKNSVQKKRTQRARSMNQKVFITIGKAKA